MIVYWKFGCFSKVEISKFKFSVTKHFPEFIQLISLSMYYDILIHTCMKQDQSYFRQVFYLREDNFGLNYKENIAFKISYKIVALFTENYPS